MPRHKQEPVVEEAQVVEEVVPSTDDVADQLRKLGAELQQAADDALARGAKLREVERFLGNLKVKDFPELAESPVVQSFIKLMGGGDLRPGQTKNPGTLAQIEREWTIRDVEEQFEKVMVMPFENIPITWNGLTIQLQARTPAMVPKPFYDIYMDHLKAQNMAKQHEDYLSGMSDRPPDANWLSDSSARVRAWSLMSRPYKQGQQWGIGVIDMSDQAPPSTEAVTPEKKGA